jgi:hypothetical protein
MKGENTIFGKKKISHAAVFFSLIVCLFYTGLKPGICYAVEALPISSAEFIPIVQDPDIIIRVKQGETVLQEKKLYLDNLEGMTLTRQIYTSLDADDTPQLILAEGIPLADLLKTMNVQLEDVQTFHIYSSEGWDRGLTKKFLFDVPRFAYPEILSAQANDQQSASDKALKEETGPKTDQAGIKDDKVIVNAFTDNEPMPVQPMLTFRCNEELMGTTIDWGKLGSNFGIRICYGQINKADVCSSLYGTHINQLEINVKPSIQNSENPNGSNAKLTGGSDDSSKDEVIGSVKDPDSGKQIDNVPTALTIKAGYFGQEYTILKTFTLAELKSLPQIKQAYTLIDGKSVVVETAVGVRLVDLMAAAGVDTNSVQVFHFYSRDNGGDRGVSLTKTYLLDTPRYFYPRLAYSWNSGPTAGAARGAIRVNTIVALKDYWKKSTTVPDFYPVNGNNRFRLVLGQTNTTTETASRSLQWIHTIEVQISGGTVEGNGAMISAGQSAEGSNDSQNNSRMQTEKMDMGKEVVAIKQEVLPDTLQEKENSKKVIYTIAPAKGIPTEEPVQCTGLIGLLSLLIFVMGAMIRYFGYRREINLYFVK